MGGIPFLFVIGYNQGCSTRPGPRDCARRRDCAPKSPDICLVKSPAITGDLARLWSKPFRGLPETLRLKFPNLPGLQAHSENLREGTLAC
jgi:hypothetical protein